MPKGSTTMFTAAIAASSRAAVEAAIPQYRMAADRGRDERPHSVCHAGGYDASARGLITVLAFP
jgi:hypothetical protein